MSQSDVEKLKNMVTLMLLYLNKQTEKRFFAVVAAVPVDV